MQASLPPLPQRVTGSTQAWPWHSLVSTRALEQAALADLAQPGHLMEAAGLAVARLALATTPGVRRVHVWSGPGNNGGDGAVAARHLHGAGLQVRLCAVGAPVNRACDAAVALDRALAAGVRIAASDGPGPQADPDTLTIDALLGIGCSRPPSADIAAAIEAINASAGPVLSIDLPSALNADTGTLWGAAAVRATTTLSLLTLKPGLFTGHGKDLAGQVWWDDLGCCSTRSDGTLSPRPEAAHRLHATHKGSFGDVAVVGGASGMEGAAGLAGSAALAAGAGRVYISQLSMANFPAGLLAGRPELMQVANLWQWAPERLRQLTALCGCGGGNGLAPALAPLLTHAPRLVLDADALNTLARETALGQTLRARRRRGLGTVLTPHPLEAARLLACSAAEVQADRLRAAQCLAQKMDCTVVLKGSGTVIASPDERPWINPNGNACLATAGTGDVLAGCLAGLWSAAPAQTPTSIATHACWIHGHIADQFAAQFPGRPLLAGHLVQLLAGWG